MTTQLKNSPDSSWLAGKYPSINAEVNTSLPYVAIGEYFWQGQEAGEVINEIHQIWSNSDLTPEEAISKYAAQLS